MVEYKSVEGILSPYRALDLTDEKGYLCGKILGDLGADVIKVEKPGGDSGRNIGPFYQDIPHPEKSLYWFAYNNNKRGITLDITSQDGKMIFLHLVESAHFVIESFPPGYMDNLGLGYAVLSQVNPKIILTSVSPFGQTRPYRDYKASDIVAMAMGGYMYLTGDVDRPPVRISFPQAYLHASVEAAVGTMIAHYYREITGEGQYVDTSAQASMCWTLMNATFLWDLARTRAMRSGFYRGWAGPAAAKQRVLWPCKDGYIAFALYGGLIGASTNKALVRWLESEGMATDYLKSIEWDTFDVGKITQDEFDRFAEPVARFFQSHTVEELCNGATQRGMMLYIVANTRDIANDPQLKERGFWNEVWHPELGTTVTYPGAFAIFSETPCRVRRRAPLIGEHNKEIYIKELGLSKEEILSLKQYGII